MNNMELFLAGVLTGSYTTRQRHIRQAKTIQTAIAERWNRDNPWTWKRKHIAWFLINKRNGRSDATWYYYRLTIKLIIKRQLHTLQFGSLIVSYEDRQCSDA